MNYPKGYVLLSMATREADGVRCGLFGTGDPAHPLTFAEELDKGEFDFASARLIPVAEALDMYSQINRATGAMN